jgi:hypothetical protein
MPENNETEKEGPVPTDGAPSEAELSAIALSNAQRDAQLRAEIQAANADGKKSAQKERFDRTTVVAFGLLFVLPALIIVLSLIFLFPLVARTLQQEPSGATTIRSNSGDIDQK